MLAIMEVQERRVKTLLARYERLNKIQREIVLSGGDWHKGETMDRWSRAQALGKKCQREIGILASIFLKEVA